MSKRVLYNITSASLQATNISGGTINAATFTGGNLSLSGDLKVAGTLTTVNITSTNLVNTNVSAGVVVASTLLSATGNSNTIGNIFTTGGNLGVGITSPSRKLHVQSDMRIGGSGAVLDFGDDFTTQIFRNATTSEMRFNTNNLSRMTITSTGNLGIGTTAPASQLDVNGSIVCRSSLSAISTSGNVAAFFASDNSVLGWSFGLDTDTSFKIKGGRAGGNQFTNSTFGTTRFTINTGGNVGIACTAPTHLFSVGIAPNGTTKGSISINTSDESRYHLFNYAGVAEWLFGQKSTSRSDFTFSKLVAGTETDYLTISTGGNVGIGTTAPAYTLDVNGTIRASTSLTTGFVSPNLLVNNATGNGSTVLALMTPNLTTGGNMAAMFFGQTSGNGNMGQLNFGYYGNNNTQNNMSLTFFGGGGSQMYLVNNGNIGIGTTSPLAKLDVAGNGRFTGPGGVGTNGSLLITGQDANTHSLYVAGAASQKRIGFGHTGTVGNIFAYDYGAMASQSLCFQLPGGNVGIGTASPTALLHILESSANNTNPSSIFIDKNGERAALQVWNYNNNTNNLQLSSNMYWNSVGGAIVHNTSGGKAWNLTMGSNQDSLRVARFTAADTSSTLFTINSAGNVGIGTTSPQALLHLHNTSMPKLTLSRYTSNIQGGNLNHGELVWKSLNRGVDSAMIRSTSQAVDGLLGWDDAGRLEFLTSVGPGALTRMVISESGNVGIGTTSPGSALHVAGLINATPGNGISMGIGSDGNSGIQLNSGANGSSNTSYIDFGYSGIDFISRIIHFNNNRSLQFQVNGSATPLILNSTGSVSITGPGGVGSNGSLLITGGDTFGHSLYVASAASHKRLAFNNTGNVGNIFAYDYGAPAVQNLALQGYGGNVGIGTSNPSFKLDVNGSIICSDWLRSSGATGWYNQTYGKGIYANDTTWVRTFPDRSSFLCGTLNCNDITTNNNNIGMGSGTIQFTNNGAGLNWGSNFSQIYDDGDLRIKTDDNMRLFCGGSEVLTLTPSITVINTRTYINNYASGNVIPLGVYAPNIGGYQPWVVTLLGKTEETNYGVAVQGYYYAGSGSTSNYYFIGFNGMSYDTQSFKVYPGGSIAKTGGTFDIIHPTKNDPKKRLIHSFIEGPRCDLIYRGTVQLENGTTTVNIDSDCVCKPESAMSQGTFEALVTNPDIFLQNKSSFDQIIGSISGNILTIVSNNTASNAMISWMVIGERKDSFIKQWNRTNSDGYLITEYTQV